MRKNSERRLVAFLAMQIYRAIRRAGMRPATHDWWAVIDAISLLHHVYEPDDVPDREYLRRAGWATAKDRVRSVWCRLRGERFVPSLDGVTARLVRIDQYDADAGRYRDPAWAVYAGHGRVVAGLRWCDLAACVAADEPVAFTYELEIDYDDQLHAAGGAS